MTMSPVDRLREAYLDACEAELRAFKPGNVSVRSPGHGMTAADFRLSAQASALPLASPAVGLGLRVYHAVADTRRAVGCNTNLGIVLLCAPLMQAVLDGTDQDLRADLARVLCGAGRDDAAWLYRAIRVAAPGGLGTAARHDVYGEPPRSVTEAMWPAARRDRIAFQYVSVFKDIFGWSVPRMRLLCERWGEESWAAVGVFLGQLARARDTHIVRRHGNSLAREVSAKAARLEEALCRSDSPEQFLPRLQELDGQLKRAGVNPGTTADLTVATLLAVRLEDLVGEQRRTQPGPSVPYRVGGPSLDGASSRNYQRKE
ncbi:MAG TPA: triphosphoribosyl-dephospho-CoA synthase [Gammaproteobacteria bacterium]|nr:triphosphoribosyl-dephospho-CoA synthase [Gammaproteobacteria bacterium]